MNDIRMSRSLEIDALLDWHMTIARRVQVVQDTLDAISSNCSRRHALLREAARLGRERAAWDATLVHCASVDAWMAASRCTWGELEYANN